MTVFYLDPAGNDANDGLSPAMAISPLHGYARLHQLLQPGDTVLFKAFGVFPGGLLLHNLADLTLGAYGRWYAVIRSETDTWGIRFVDCPNTTFLAPFAFPVGSGVTPDGLSSNRYAAFEWINTALSGTIKGPTIPVGSIQQQHHFGGAVEIRGSAASWTGPGSGFHDTRIEGVISQDSILDGIRARTMVLLDENGQAITWDQYDMKTTLPSPANNLQIFRGFTFPGWYDARNFITRAYGNALTNTGIHTGDGIYRQNIDGLGKVINEYNTVLDCGTHGEAPTGNWCLGCKDAINQFYAVWNQKSRTPLDGDGIDMDGDNVNVSFRYGITANCNGAGVLCGPYGAIGGGDTPLGCSVSWHLSINDARVSPGYTPFYAYGGAILSGVDSQNNPLATSFNFVFQDTTPPPPGWETGPWAGGGSATINGTQVSVDGAKFGTTGSYSAPQTLEFDAVFSSDPYQHCGFAVDYNAPPWACFSTFGGGAIYARTDGQITQLASGLIGTSHRYRIDWLAGAVEYRVDGVLVVTHTPPSGNALRVVASDYSVGDGHLLVAWVSSWLPLVS